MSYGACVENFAVIVAALSLVVSIFVLVRQRQVEGRAHFTAEWEVTGSVSYVNHGPGAAKDVRIKLDYEASPVEQAIPYIGAFQSMRVGVRWAMSAAPPQRLDVSWKDNRQARQSLAIHLPELPAPPRRPPRGSIDRVLRDMAKEEAEDVISDQKSFERYVKRME